MPATQQQTATTVSLNELLPQLLDAADLAADAAALQDVAPGGSDDAVVEELMRQRRALLTRLAEALRHDATDNGTLSYNVGSFLDAGEFITSALLRADTE